jgi:hypothetical protein
MRGGSVSSLKITRKIHSYMQKEDTTNATNKSSHMKSDRHSRNKVY